MGEWGIEQRSTRGHGLGKAGLCRSLRGVASAEGQWRAAREVRGMNWFSPCSASYSSYVTLRLSFNLSAPQFSYL